MRIGRICLPDFIREKIKKKVELTELIKEKFKDGSSQLFLDV